MAMLNSKILGFMIAAIIFCLSAIGFANDINNTVNWYKGDVTAIGVGYPPEEIGLRGNSIARRAAMVDAQRNLLEITKGVQIDAETTVENMTVSSDVVNSKVQGLLKGAQIFEEGNLDDGGYYVKMRIALYERQFLENYSADSAATMVNEVLP